MTVQWEGEIRVVDKPLIQWKWLETEKKMGLQVELFFREAKSRARNGKTQSSMSLPMGMLMKSQRVGDREGLSIGLEFEKEGAAFCGPHIANSGVVVHCIRG